MSFRDRALQLIANGYRIVPIPHGSKAADLVGWPKLHATVEDVEKWAKMVRYANGNIGLITEATPIVDIDIYDASMAQEMEEWVLKTFGDTMVRVGMAPKRALVFRAERPFAKRRLDFTDGKTKHGIEILATGQQAVAYGIHPDTRKPYAWTSFDEPLDTPASALPVLSALQADAILDEYDRRARARGWTSVSRTNAKPASESDDPFGAYKPILKISKDTILETLDAIPNDDTDYDTWLTVGFALNHQFGGSDEGLELWHQWGNKSDKYDAGETNRKWESMGHGPDTATFASLLYTAKQIQVAEKDREFESAMNRINLENDPKVLMGGVLKKLAQFADDDLQIDISCKRVQERMVEIAGVKPRLETIRKALQKHRPKLDLANREMPKWCEGWVFVAKMTQFFHPDTGRWLSKTAFDAIYGGNLLTDQMRAAGHIVAGKASDAALNLHRMPAVYDAVYMPGADRFLKMGRTEVVNTFSLASVPLPKQPSTPDEYEAIRQVETHFELLFPDKIERTILLDYLSYCVQFPGEKITWGVLIQGVDGAGKSWFSTLMSSILGRENVRNVPASAMKENFTGWAEGRMMVFFEEVRIAGYEKFELLDKLKPFVGNPEAPVRKMQREQFEVPNVTNYWMFTNYLASLPINKNDRRYFILRAAFLTKSHIDEFNADNPSYFTDLFNSTYFHADVLRHWFATRAISDGFKPKGHAPDTEDKDLVQEESESQQDTLSVLYDLIRTAGDPMVTENLLCGSRVRELDGTFAAMPSRTFGALLERAGFALIGKYRTGTAASDPKYSFYTKHSKLFSGQKHDRLAIIRRMIEPPEPDGFD